MAGGWNARVSWPCRRSVEAPRTSRRVGRDPGGATAAAVGASGGGHAAAAAARSRGRGRGDADRLLRLPSADRTNAIACGAAGVSGAGGAPDPLRASLEAAADGAWQAGRRSLTGAGTD